MSHLYSVVTRGHKKLPLCCDSQRFLHSGDGEIHPVAGGRLLACGPAARTPALEGPCADLLSSQALRGHRAGQVWASGPGLCLLPTRGAPPTADPTGRTLRTVPIPPVLCSFGFCVALLLKALRPEHTESIRLAGSVGASSLPGSSADHPGLPCAPSPVHGGWWSGGAYECPALPSASSLRMSSWWCGDGKLCYLCRHCPLRSTDMWLPALL